MRNDTITTPHGVERTFGPEEIIVTKTDLQGRITYANEVFLRVAAFREEEVMGKPHNIIRHPDMPRSVFKLLWDTIEAGNEIFAYVKNLAHDNMPYWVFAHVTPTFRDGRIVGYHSNRRLPDRGAIDAVTPIYAALLAEERKYKAADQVRAGVALLTQVLESNRVTYDQFVWSITKVAA